MKLHLAFATMLVANSSEAVNLLYCCKTQYVANICIVLRHDVMPVGQTVHLEQLQSRHTRVPSPYTPL